MRLQFLRRCRRTCVDAIRRRALGATLIEVTVAVIVLALLLACVPPVLLAIAKAQYSWSEQRTAESLARNTVEFVKATPYIYGNGTNWWPEYEPPDYVPNTTWDIEIAAQPVNTDTHEPLYGEDEGMQEVTVTIKHVDEEIVETMTYKVDRLELFTR
jgi:type II secretory pathway pseudopilin PulG